MIRVGIIGCGKIAQIRHIPEYISNENACIAGYYDFVSGRAEELACKYGGSAYKSVEALLDDPDINAVSVCVANHAHAQVSIQALRAGKHVLCEKPMAVTIEECEQMVEEARLAGKFLMIGQNQRLAGAHQKARELIRDGIIGKVLTFKTCFGHSGPDHWSVDSGTSNWFFDKSKSAFGALADLGVHKTDLIQYLLDSNVCQVQSMITTLDKKYEDGTFVDVDDNAISIYQMENGAIGTMTASWTYYGQEDNSTIIYGTEGLMKIYVPGGHSIDVYLKNGRHLSYDTDAIQTNETQTRSGIIDAFVNALIIDEEPPISGRDVLNAMRTVFASVESAKTGRAVSVPLCRKLNNGD